MTNPLVRTHWISGAADFITAHYSSDAADRITNGLPAEVRAALARRDPDPWSPRAHHVSLMSAIVSAQRDEVAAFDDLMAYGQHVGDELMSGVLKPFMQIVSLKLFAKKLPALWARDHQDESRLECDLVALDDSRLAFKLVTVRGYDHVGIAMLGWVKAAMIRLTKKAVVVKQGGWSVNRPGPNEVVGEVSW